MNVCRTPPSLKYVSGAPGNLTLVSRRWFNSPRVVYAERAKWMGVIGVAFALMSYWNGFAHFYMILLQKYTQNKQIYNRSV